MTTRDQSPSVESVESPTLNAIVERNHVWPVMAAKYGVENPVPP